VLEVGLGGRFDATNVIAIRPRLHHLRCARSSGILGNTLTPSQPKIRHHQGRQALHRRPQPDEAKDVITRRAINLALRFMSMAKISAPTPNAAHGLSGSEGLLDLPLPKLIGRHQIANAAVAIAALRRIGGRWGREQGVEWD